MPPTHPSPSSLSLLRPARHLLLLLLLLLLPSHAPSSATASPASAPALAPVAPLLEAEVDAHNYHLSSEAARLGTLTSSSRYDEAVHETFDSPAFDPTRTAATFHVSTVPVSPTPVWNMHSTAAERAAAVAATATRAYSFVGTSSVGMLPFVFATPQDNVNPILTVERGQRYLFRLRAPGYPLLIKSAVTSGRGDTYDWGVDPQGISLGLLRFHVPTDAPDTLYYVCEFDALMFGQIRVVSAGHFDVTDHYTSSIRAANIPAFGTRANHTALLNAQAAAAAASAAVTPLAALASGTTLKLDGAGCDTTATARPENMALGKAVTQSSTILGGAAARAVDGSTRTTWDAGSCTHTAWETNPWWRVDLEAPVYAETVTIYARGPCCDDVMDEVRGTAVDFTDLEVLVSDAPTLAQTDSKTERCANAAAADGLWTVPKGSSTAVPCARKGRFVYVVLCCGVVCCVVCIVCVCVCNRRFFVYVLCLYS